MKTRNFERKNGWVDTNSANLYKVLYHFDMALTMHLPEAVLALAKEYEKQQLENKKNSDFMGINDWGNMFQLKVSANQWVNGQDNFPQRRDGFLNRCESCMAYWNSGEGGKDAKMLRRYAYLQSWSHFESMGFKDEHKKGGAVVWNNTSSFMKTENGWMQAN